MSVFDDAADDILEGFGDAVTVVFQPAGGAPRDVRVRWLDPFVEINADGQRVMARDHHAIGLASALSDASQGDSILKGTERWAVIRPKPNGAFLVMQVERALVEAPGTGST